MTSHTRSVQRILRFWKSQLVELSPASGEDGWLSLARGGLGQVSHEMGGMRWKSQNRKNVYLSPYVKEPLNSKIIKSFVPELRSRKCFSCFEIPMFYVCMYIYIYIWTSMYVSYSRIWLWYNSMLTLHPTQTNIHNNFIINIHWKWPKFGFW